jgi:hypothetical protein
MRKERQATNKEYMSIAAFASHSNVRGIWVQICPIEIPSLYPYIMTREQRDRAQHFLERWNNMREGILPLGDEEI